MKKISTTRVEWGKNLLCGLFIGAGAILPGVSGGVMAVVFGVYRPFMELLTRPKDALPRYWRIFLPLGIGWCGGFWLFANGIAVAFEHSVTVTAWLFIGLIAGTIPSLFREAGRNGRSVADWCSLFLCAPVMFCALRCIQMARPMEPEMGFFWYTVCGVLWGTGIVIPGFSASPVMMALGIYQPMLERFADMDIRAFAQCIPGMGLTVVSLARVMTWLFRTHQSVLSHGITGIVAASTAAMVFSQRAGYSGVGEITASAFCCAGGFALAFFLERFNRVHTPGESG